MPDGGRENFSVLTGNARELRPSESLASRLGNSLESSVIIHSGTAPPSSYRRPVFVNDGLVGPTFADCTFRTCPSDAGLLRISCGSKTPDALKPLLWTGPPKDFAPTSLDVDAYSKLFEANSLCLRKSDSKAHRCLVQFFFSLRASGMNAPRYQSADVVEGNNAQAHDPNKRFDLGCSWNDVEALKDGQHTNDARP